MGKIIRRAFSKCSEKTQKIIRRIRVRFLAPKILESILNGTQDPELTIKELTEMANKII